jgi:hypothetical protein
MRQPLRHRKAMDGAFRKEARFLATRRGTIAKEQCGPKTFAATENLRQLSNQIRQCVEPLNFLQTRLLEVASGALASGPASSPSSNYRQ